MNPLLANLAERAGLQTDEEYARERADKQEQHKQALTKVLRMALDDQEAAAFVVIFSCLFTTVMHIRSTLTACEIWTVDCTPHASRS